MSVSTNLLAANVADVETDTSGWTAGANTTLAQSTRFYTGAHSLAMTRTTSAGAASATTAARVAVVAGTVYTAYAYFALIMAAAGRTATVAVSWWAASSGGTAISTSTSAAATLANSTAWNAPPPILLATAPAGALYASVTVTVSGMSTSDVVACDAIALGVPNLLSGNLFDYNTQGTEVDASQWANVTNCAVSRASTVSYEGWWSLTATSTASGAMTYRTVPLTPVTVGTEYFGYVWQYAPVTGASVAVDILWYDVSSSLLSTSTATWTSTATTWTRIAVIATAPASAAYARLQLRPTATASAQVWTSDQAAVMVAPNAAGNLVGYAAYGAEVSTAGWTISGGATVARSTAAAAEGVASIAITCTGASDAVLTLATPAPVTAGQAYQFRPAVRPPSDGASYTVHLDWLNSSGASIRQTSAAWSFSAGASTTWSYSYTADLAPAGAVSVRPSLIRSGATPGEVWYLDTLLVAAGGLAAWVESISGAYGARVHIQGLTTGSRTTWGLWRTALDGSQTPVRGYSGDITAQTITGDLAVQEDYESPLGVPVSYYVKVWSGTDWIAYSADWLTLPYPDSTSVVIKDPSLPSRNSTFVVITPPDWQRTARQGTYVVRQRARPVVLSDVRSARTGSLAITTELQSERDALWWLLSTGNPLLIQWPADWSESDVYVAVGDATEKRASTYAPQTDREWDLALTEVDRPVGALVGSASRTWLTISTGYTDWSGVQAAANTWLDVLTGVRGS